MVHHSTMVRADGSITIPRMLRIQMDIAPNDLVTVEPDRNSGKLILTIHHMAHAKGETKT